MIRITSNFICWIRNEFDGWCHHWIFQFSVVPFALDRAYRCLYLFNIIHVDCIRNECTSIGNFPISTKRNVALPISNILLKICVWITKKRNMESFTLFRAHLETCGIALQRATQNSFIFNFNSKNSAVMVLTIFGGIATNKLVDDAKTFDEYADILYRTMFLYIISVFYAYIICKTPELFEFVNKLESSVGRSKYSRPLYWSELEQLAFNLPFSSIRIRSRSEIARAVHRGKSTNYKVDTTGPLHLDKGYAAAVYIAIDCGELLCLLHHRFGQRCFCICVCNVVMTEQKLWTKSPIHLSFYVQRFPFDTKSPTRFCVAIVLQYFLIVNIMVTIACFYLIVIATLPMLFPLADDIKRDLKVLQRSLRDIEQRKRMAKPLAQLIQFHSDTKQLGFNFSQTHSRFIEFYFFFWIVSDWHVSFHFFGISCWWCCCHTFSLASAVNCYWSNSKW